MTNNVTAVPAAPSDLAREHFAAEFTFEADCWDVHDALQGEPGFVLLDVRSPALFEKGHVPGAINLPHGKIIRSKMARWPEDIVRDLLRRPALQRCRTGALRLAELGRPVKIMAGGVTGWIDEGFELATGNS